MSKEKYTGPKVTDTETFVQKASWVHGGKYDYSNSVYINAKTKVDIYCPVHGDFQQNPYSHTKGSNCPACALQSRAEKRRKSLDWFIKEAFKIHGNKYDYSMIKEFKNTHTRVPIVCPRHGVFYSYPCNHIYHKKGCKMCAPTRPVEPEGFLEKARILHDNFYNYDMETFKGVREKIRIFCPQHGWFWQEAASHLSGRGCSVCGFSKRANKLRLTHDDFMMKCKEVHSNKYDYSSTIYKGMKETISVRCPVHGEVEMVAWDHLNGSGCPFCRYVKMAETRRMSTSEFVGRAKDVHGGKYDYYCTEYTSYYDDVEISCPTHGVFLQSPNVHLTGSGCKKCADFTRGASQRSDTQTFVDNSLEIHGHLYSYDLVNYINNHTKVEITCPQHGVFEQAPSAHMTGNGCPVCADGARGYYLDGYYGTLKPSNIYVLKISNFSETFIKVGLSKNIKQRVSQIAKESECDVKILYTTEGRAYCLFLLEQTILRYSNLRRHVPSKSFGGQSECLELSELPKVLEIIQEWVDNQSEDCYS